ncbi:MAG TPA: hypothetical protein PLT04_04345 [Candidatus Saccharibacteria bacterium]|nr:hypothetical protein [Candidatus Saccharibacteria bacterium]
MEHYTDVLTEPYQAYSPIDVRSDSEAKKFLVDDKRFRVFLDEYLRRPKVVDLGSGHASSVVDILSLVF